MRRERKERGEVYIFLFHHRNAATIFANIGVFVTLIVLLFAVTGSGLANKVSNKDEWLFSVSE